MNFKGKLVRSGIPNSLDTLPKGTECLVMKKNNRCDIYIQRSSNENKPDWFLLEEDVELDGAE